MIGIEPKVKGNFFQRIVIFVKKKTGESGLTKLGLSPDTYVHDRWYPYNEFCSLLQRTQDLLKDAKTSVSYKLGYETMHGDERWHSLFKGQDPKDVFGTNKRQDALFMVGRFEIQSVQDGRVEVKMSLWSKDEANNRLWAQFYHGVMQGVMDITGKPGQVAMEEAQGAAEKVWLYRMTWN